MFTYEQLGVAHVTISCRRRRRRASTTPLPSAARRCPGRVVGAEESSTGALAQELRVVAAEARPRRRGSPAPAPARQRHPRSRAARFYADHGDETVDPSAPHLGARALHVGQRAIPPRSACHAHQHVSAPGMASAIRVVAASRRAPRARSAGRPSSTIRLSPRRFSPPSTSLVSAHHVVAALGEARRAHRAHVAESHHHHLNPCSPSEAPSMPCGPARWLAAAPMCAPPVRARTGAAGASATRARRERPSAARAARAGRASDRSDLPGPGPPCGCPRPTRRASP